MATTGPTPFVFNLGGRDAAASPQTVEVRHVTVPGPDDKPTWTLALEPSAKGHNLSVQVRFTADDADVVEAMLARLLAVAATGQTGAVLLAGLARDLSTDPDSGQKLATTMAEAARAAVVQSS